MSAARCLRKVGAMLTIGWLLAGGRSALAVDLMDAWHAARQNDLDYIAARASQQAMATHREQAVAMWRPTVTTPWFRRATAPAPVRNPSSTRCASSVLEGLTKGR